MKGWWIGSKIKATLIIIIIIIGSRHYSRSCPLRKGEALITDDRTHEPSKCVKSIQVLQGPAQVEHCALHAGEPTEHCAQPTRELRARDHTRTRWYRPLTAVTNGHGGNRGTRATLDKSVQLVRSALAQRHRSAICTGTLGAHPSTGLVNDPYNRVYYKPPAYCGRHTAPTALTVVRGVLVPGYRSIYAAAAATIAAAAAISYRSAYTIDADVLRFGRRRCDTRR